MCLYNRVVFASGIKLTAVTTVLQTMLWTVTEGFRIYLSVRLVFILHC